MNTNLQYFLGLEGDILEEYPDNFVYKLKLSDTNISIVQNFYNSNFIERIKYNDSYITLDDLSNYLGKFIFIQFLNAELKKNWFFLILRRFSNSSPI